MSQLVTSKFLRGAIAADAGVTGLVGVVLALDAGALEAPLGVPAVLMQPLGLVFVAYALALAALATRRTLPVALVWTLVAGNTLWVVESLVALAAGWLAPTPLGYGFVLVQAAAVGVFAELQFIGLRRSERYVH